MGIKGIGALLIVLGCGGFGFSMAAAHRREEAALRQLLLVLDLMECELQYRLTPLPELLLLAERETTGVIQRVLRRLRKELEAQVSPDARTCMEAALAAFPELPAMVCGGLRNLGISLGRFDLPGQLQGIHTARGECQSALDRLCSNRDNRLRSYETLGLCAGAALAILLL